MDWNSRQLASHKVTHIDTHTRGPSERDATKQPQEGHAVTHTRTQSDAVVECSQ